MLPVSAISRAKGPPICNTGNSQARGSAVWKEAIKNNVPVEYREIATQVARPC